MADLPSVNAVRRAIRCSLPSASQRSCCGHSTGQPLGQDCHRDTEGLRWAGGSRGPPGPAGSLRAQGGTQVGLGISTHGHPTASLCSPFQRPLTRTLSSSPSRGSLHTRHPSSCHWPPPSRLCPRPLSKVPQVFAELDAISPQPPPWADRSQPGVPSQDRASPPQPPRPVPAASAASPSPSTTPARCGAILPPLSRERLPHHPSALLSPPLPPPPPPAATWRRPAAAARCACGCCSTTLRRAARAARCAGCCSSPTRRGSSPTCSASSATGSASAAGPASASSWTGRCCRPPRAPAWCGTTTR